MTRISTEEAQKLIENDPGLAQRCPELVQIVKASPKPRKYHNVKTDGFDSGHEAVRAGELEMEWKAHEIFCLSYQVPIEVQPEGYKKKVIYRADFVYLDKMLKVVVEDAKPFDKKTGKFLLTKDFSLKRKMFEEKFGIKITLV
jgi:hypothetical protein